jgi:hypothetical protein
LVLGKLVRGWDGGTAGKKCVFLPEVLLAEPVLALSREAAEELPEETPEDEKA